MGTGIATVWKATGRGSLHVVIGREHVAGILSAALGSGDNNNPFQSELGLGEDFIFNPDDPTTLTDIRERVESIVQRLQGYELLSLQLRSDNLTLRKTDVGEYAIPVYIIDLETDDEYAFEIVDLEGGNPSVR